MSEANKQRAAPNQREFKRLTCAIPPDVVHPLIEALRSVCPVESPEDSLEEVFQFTPLEIAGNLNYALRQVHLSIRYSRGRRTDGQSACVVRYKGAPVPLPAPLIDTMECFAMTESTATPSIRQLLIGSGFDVIADHGRNGIRFTTASRVEICLFRPTNVTLDVAMIENHGVAEWQATDVGPSILPEAFTLCEVSSMDVTATQLIEFAKSILSPFGVTEFTA